MRGIMKSILLALLMSITTASLRVPLLSRKEYTPLVFFTIPKGFIPECDVMEKVVSEVEHELGVRVERLDVARDEAAQAAMSVLTQRRPPFLYHRESCQVVYAPNISKSRVRAWAKGRIITSQSSSSGTKSKPLVVSKDENAIDQKDLIEDATLSPMQKSGKDKAKERTEELGKKNSK